MNKRNAVLDLVKANGRQEYVPAAFFLHFDADHHRGQAAIDRHLEYFHATGMDIVKIQYEHPFPKVPEIRQPKEWVRMPRYGADFFRDPLEAASELVKAAGKEALVVVTLYSPLMLAAQATSREQVTEHLAADPESAKKGLEIIAESMLVFVRECVKRGVDGFYASTQGGESGRFRDKTIFTRFIKPIDLIVMNEINRICPFNILHVCDYHGVYDDLSAYLDYPGTIVNCGTRLASGPISMKEISDGFRRPFMGGMDRHGTLVSGTQEDIRREVREVLRQAPARFMLGADCTVPSDIPWRNLKTAIAEAHGSQS
jgi:uroporphyrinogen decarboxylase